MAAVAASGPYAESPDGQLHVVVDDYQLFRLGAEPGHQILDAFPAIVDEGAGLGQHNRSSPPVSLPQHRFGALVGLADSPNLAQLVHATEPQVVARALVAGPGVAQAYDDKHGGTRLGQLTGSVACWSNMARKASSSSTSVPSRLAVSSLEPADSPATR